MLQAIPVLFSFLHGLQKPGNIYWYILHYAAVSNKKSTCKKLLEIKLTTKYEKLHAAALVFSLRLDEWGFCE